MVIKERCIRNFLEQDFRNSSILQFYYCVTTISQPSLSLPLKRCHFCLFVKRNFLTRVATGRAYFPTVVYQIKLHIDYFLEFLPVERIWETPPRLKEEMRSLTANEYNWSNSKISAFFRKREWTLPFISIKNTKKPSFDENCHFLFFRLLICTS